MDRPASDTTRRSPSSAGKGPPEFLNLLGIAPPVTVEDVKQAFLARVKKAHPDVGGDPAEFMALQEAFDQATEYASFFESRRGWLSNSVERYVAQEQIVAEVQRLGGSVETTSIDWLRDEIGDDFSQLLDRISGIRLTGSGVGEAQVNFLIGQHKHLDSLRSLDISAARIGDNTALGLRQLANLERINLTGTAVTNAIFALAEVLPSLRWLGVSGTRVSWFATQKARRRFPEVTIER